MKGKNFKCIIVGKTLPGLENDSNSHLLPDGKSCVAVISLYFYFLI
jgi:hypothetical protein